MFCKKKKKNYTLAYLSKRDMFSIQIVECQGCDEELAPICVFSWSEKKNFVALDYSQ